MIDCHVHTGRCRHAVGTPLEYVAAAERAGVDVIAFTDHMPFLDGRETDYAMSLTELPAYVDDILQLRGRAVGPEVLLGIEADWFAGADAGLAAALGAYPFDLVMGSVHFVDGWAFDDPALVARYTETDIDELWRRYFAELCAAARSGLFDVMGHPDLVKKFGYLPSFDPVELYEEAAAAFVEGGVAIDVNAAGLSKPCAEVYPSLPFLKACRRQGVPASPGSDAHRPECVGAGLDQAAVALLSAGYESVVFFRQRRRVERILR